MDLSVVIPAYNEVDGLRPTIEALAATLTESAQQLQVEIVLVDDGSTDGTSEVGRALEAEIDSVRLLVHPRNRGYGAALKTGIHGARANVVAITDADGTYPNERLLELYQRLLDEDADMVIGSRTGANVHIPLIRRPAKATLNFLANYLSGHKIPDLNSGMRIMRTEPLITCFNLVSDGFSFTTTTLLAFLARGHKVVYVPIDYHARTGNSKIRPIQDTFNFMVLILRVAIYFEPLKVFLPVTLLLGTLGVLWGAGQIASDQGLGDLPVLLLVSALQIGLVGLIADMISRRN